MIWSLCLNQTSVKSRTGFRKLLVKSFAGLQLACITTLRGDIPDRWNDGLLPERYKLPRWHGDPASHSIPEGPQPGTWLENRPHMITRLFSKEWNFGVGFE